MHTTDGVVTYSTTFTATGVQTTVTVNSAGTLTSLPTTTTTTFSALSSTVQTELSTLAKADGVTASIASNQSVSVLTETNGTVIYSVTLSATGSGYNGSTYTFDVTVSSDANGNPTTLPNDGGFETAASDSSVISPSVAVIQPTPARARRPTLRPEAPTPAVRYLSPVPRQLPRQSCRPAPAPRIQNLPNCCPAASTG